MLKLVRHGVVALAVISAACATSPPVPEAPPAVEPPAEAARREAPLRVGVILSSTGSAVLRQYGDMVLEGVRLAAGQASTSQRAVEVVVRDDGGTTAGAVAALRELEQAGISVIVGPLVDEAVGAAARARTRESTLIISPTAISQPAATRNVLALNAVDTRGASALGEYARRYARVGMLYPRSPESVQQARAFAAAYARGGQTVRDEGFDPGATTVTAQLRRLRDARVEAVFIPASERHLQLVLPQVDYAGMGGVQLLGTDGWLPEASPGVPQRLIEGAIVATPLVRESADVAWSEFVALYENTHRRTLQSAIPALGYDALLLGVRAAAAGGRAMGDYRGATGVMSLQGDSITRRPFLVRIQSGRLVPLQ
jgi:ABC-type branched-subunit amino acid transport system substrate-binding protein